jgi:luciferase family oxidoreductase group 1
MDLARHAEKWGFHRYWLAEHHGMPGIASAATSVLIGHIASGTSTIRVGAGGIMLPNHAPLVIAEQFGTLECLYPGRIDLGLGRAPGTDQQTARALRRESMSSGDTFPADLQELLSYFQPALPGQKVRAVPGEGVYVPVWLLGSSTFSAQLAAQLGLPFAFASHFAPDSMLHALSLYRSTFQPSAHLQEPYVTVGVNVFAADSDAEGARLFTSLQQAFLNLIRNKPGKLEAPVDSLQDIWEPQEQQYIERSLRMTAAGSPATVQNQLEAVLELTAADELMLTAQIYDHMARLRSLEIAAQVMQRINR